MPIQGNKYSKENGSYSNVVCIQFSIPRQAKKNVPSYRSSPHHGVPLKKGRALVMMVLEAVVVIKTIDLDTHIGIASAVEVIKNVQPAMI